IGNDNGTAFRLIVENLLYPRLNGDVFRIAHQYRLAFRPLQRFIQGRDPVVGKIPFRLLEPELPDSFQRIVRHLTRTGGRPVEGRVMHEHNLPVFGVSSSDLKNSRPVRTRIFKGRDTILGEPLSRPAAVSTDKRYAVRCIPEKVLQVSSVLCADRMKARSLRVWLRLNPVKTRKDQDNQNKACNQ